MLYRAKKISTPHVTDSKYYFRDNAGQWTPARSGFPGVTSFRAKCNTSVDMYVVADREYSIPVELQNRHVE
jgi:hypothetical protein